MYDKGLGVSQSFATAFDWYRKAAASGSAKAQNNLGYMYSKGLGVKKDEKKAASWFRSSADQFQPDPDAMNSLRLAYKDGNGVPRDLVQAWVWFSRGALWGDQDASSNLRTVQYLMVPDQIAEAQVQFELWKNQHSHP